MPIYCVGKDIVVEIRDARITLSKHILAPSTSDRMQVEDGLESLTICAMPLVQS